jgi:hypothetical protein
MEGKFRERAKTIWCPKPQPEKRITQEDILWREIYTINGV